MLDIFAITTVIVHAIGRFGCFMAGCCFGLPTENPVGIVFPTTTPVKVHPTQLYEITMLIIILFVLQLLKKHKKFNGQLFLSYLILYAFGRGILEFFRGDKRGFIIEDILSHSQFIALCFIALTAYFYHKFYTKNKLTLNI